MIHLGHILQYNLNDEADIIRATKDLLRKANYILCTFSFADPFDQLYHFVFHCMDVLCG